MSKSDKYSFVPDAYVASKDVSQTDSGEQIPAPKKKKFTANQLNKIVSMLPDDFKNLTLEQMNVIERMIEQDPNLLEEKTPQEITDIFNKTLQEEQNKKLSQKQAAPQKTDVKKAKTPDSDNKQVDKPSHSLGAQEEKALETLERVEKALKEQELLGKLQEMENRVAQMVPSMQDKVNIKGSSEKTVSKTFGFAKKAVSYVFPLAAPAIETGRFVLKPVGDTVNGIVKAIISGIVMIAGIGLLPAVKHLHWSLFRKEKDLENIKEKLGKLSKDQDDFYVECWEVLTSARLFFKNTKSKNPEQDFVNLVASHGRSEVLKAAFEKIQGDEDNSWYKKILTRPVYRVSNFTAEGISNLYGFVSPSVSDNMQIRFSCSKGKDITSETVLKAINSEVDHRVDDANNKVKFLIEKADDQIDLTNCLEAAVEKNHSAMFENILSRVSLESLEQEIDLAKSSEEGQEQESFVSDLDNYCALLQADDIQSQSRFLHLATKIVEGGGGELFDVLCQRIIQDRAANKDAFAQDVQELVEYILKKQPSENAQYHSYLAVLKDHNVVGIKTIEKILEIAITKNNLEERTLIDEAIKLSKHELFNSTGWENIPYGEQKCDYQKLLNLSMEYQNIAAFNLLFNENLKINEDNINSLITFLKSENIEQVKFDLLGGLLENAQTLEQRKEILPLLVSIYEKNAGLKVLLENFIKQPGVGLYIQTLFDAIDEGKDNIVKIFVDASSVQTGLAFNVLGRNVANLNIKDDFNCISYKRGDCTAIEKAAEKGRLDYVRLIIQKQNFIDIKILTTLLENISSDHLGENGNDNLRNFIDKFLVQELNKEGILPLIARKYLQLCQNGQEDLAGVFLHQLKNLSQKEGLELDCLFGDISADNIDYCNVLREIVNSNNTTLKLSQDNIFKFIKNEIENASDSQIMDQCFKRINQFSAKLLNKEGILSLIASKYLQLCQNGEKELAGVFLQQLKNLKEMQNIDLTQFFEVQYDNLSQEYHKILYNSLDYFVKNGTLQQKQFEGKRSAVLGFIGHELKNKDSSKIIPAFKFIYSNKENVWSLIDTKNTKDLDQLEDIFKASNEIYKSFRPDIDTSNLLDNTKSLVNSTIFEPNDKAHQDMLALVNEFGPIDFSNKINSYKNPYNCGGLNQLMLDINSGEVRGEKLLELATNPNLSIIELFTKDGVFTIPKITIMGARFVINPNLLINENSLTFVVKKAVNNFPAVGLAGNLGGIVGLNGFNNLLGYGKKLIKNSYNEFVSSPENQQEKNTLNHEAFINALGHAVGMNKTDKDDNEEFNSLDISNTNLSNVVVVVLPSCSPTKTEERPAQQKTVPQIFGDLGSRSDIWDGKIQNKKNVFKNTGDTTSTSKVMPNTASTNSNQMQQFVDQKLSSNLGANNTQNTSFEDGARLGIDLFDNVDNTPNFNFGSSPLGIFNIGGRSLFGEGSNENSDPSQVSFPF